MTDGRIDEYVAAFELLAHRASIKLRQTCGRSLAGFLEDSPEKCIDIEDVHSMGKRGPTAA